MAAGAESLQLPRPAAPRAYTVLDEAAAAAALEACAARCGRLASLVLDAVAASGDAGLAPAHIRTAAAEAAAVGGRAGASSSASKHRPRPRGDNQPPRRREADSDGAVDAAVAELHANPHPNRDPNRDPNPIPIQVAALHEASLLVRVTVDDERRYVAHTHTACWAAPPYALGPAPPAALAAVAASRAAAVARQRLPDPAGKGGGGGGAVAAAAAAAAAAANPAGGLGSEGEGGGAAGGAAGGGGAAPAEERGAREEGERSHERERTEKAERERERLRLEEEAREAAGVTPSGKRARYDEGRFFVPAVGMRVDGSVDEAHVRQLQRALLCRVAVSPGISASSLLERFGAYGACHVREQLQQLQEAGLLRCTALTVRTPQLFGAGRGAELKHYFPVPGVGLSWVAASGSG